MIIHYLCVTVSGMGRYNNRNNNSLGGKSLLEQLLIEIPSDNSVEIRRSGMSTRNTRSQVKGYVSTIYFFSAVPSFTKCLFQLD